MIDVPSTNGVLAKAYDFGGNGRPFVLGHATGLHAHMYAPLLEVLRQQFHCYAVEVRGQGAATIPIDGNFSWAGITEDFVRGLVALNLSGRGDVLGMGHSQGGYSVLSAALALPGTFAGLFCFEAIVFPPEFDQGQGDSGMATNARKRREVFPSKQAAYDNYKAKLPFSSIDDECLRAYVEYGFDDNLEHDHSDGTTSSVRLRCRANSEAELFSNARTGLFSRLPEIECPTAIGYSDFSGEHFKLAAVKQAEELPKGTLHRFAGRSHFGPFERSVEFANDAINLFHTMVP